MPVKTVVIEATLDKKYKMESVIDNHTIVIDQPQKSGGTNAGPDPLSYFLLSLAGCIGAIARIIANQKKIKLRSMKLKVQGDLDTDVLLGKNASDRAGFAGIDVNVSMDSDMNAEEQKAFIDEVNSRCPISENISNTTTVSVNVQKN